MENELREGTKFQGGGEKKKVMEQYQFLLKPKLSTSQRFPPFDSVPSV